MRREGCQEFPPPSRHAWERGDLKKRTAKGFGLNDSFNTHIQFHFPPQSYSREESWPASSAVKLPPAYAGDGSSVPEPERSICWEARGSQLLSLCSRAQELQPLSPHATPEAHAPERPHSIREAELEKSLHSSEGPAQPKLLAKLLQSCPTLRRYGL